jgi:hypothetical protein
MNQGFRFILILFFCHAALFPNKVSAQLSQGGIPRSFALSMPPVERDIVTLTSPDMDVLAREDEQNPLPYRFAVNLPVSLGIDSSGLWERAKDGTNIWRLSLTSPGALAITLYFDQFQIPEGGKLFVYNPNRTQWLGAFTSLNNNSLFTFATGLIYGDQLTLEYNTPDGLEPPLIHISEVAHAYRGVAEYTSLKTGFGSAGKCMVNVNCSEGDQWATQKRGVARIEVKKGTSISWCTGSLVNNTSNDGKPYILTADHCGGSATATDLSKWIFYFNYESSGCPNPTAEPSLKSITGATLVSRSGGNGYTGSDFYMVLLNSTIPDSYNVYFNGWSRDETPSSSGVSIHHPQGDIKKISTYTAPLQRSNYPGNPDQAHWKVNWSATTHGYGTTEGGSSGSPIFDTGRRLVGTLTGGDSSCDSAALGLPDYYGMFSFHWNQNGSEPTKQLEPWLDPIKSGVMALNGWALSVDEQEMQDRITLYPNPVLDQLHIRNTLGKEENFQVVLYDLWGRALLTMELNALQNRESHIDLAGLTRGMYLISIGDGERWVMRKIVKQ